jgi:lipoprotein
MKINILMRNSIVLSLFGLSFLLQSCSSIGLMDKGTPMQINDFGDFFSMYIVLQISILLIAIILSLFLGDIGYIISLLLHFIWIISYRDYGFFTVLMLFGLATIVSLGIKMLIFLYRNRK